MLVLLGADIKRASTLNTMYADGKIEVEANDGSIFRLGVDDILEMLKENSFLIEKKRKYNHLKLCKKS